MSQICGMIGSRCQQGLVGTTEGHEMCPPIPRPRDLDVSTGAAVPILGTLPYTCRQGSRRRRHEHTARTVPGEPIPVDERRGGAFKAHPPLSTRDPRHVQASLSGNLREPPLRTAPATAPPEHPRRLGHAPLAPGRGALIRAHAFLPDVQASAHPAVWGS